MYPNGLNRTLSEPNGWIARVQWWIPDTHKLLPGLAILIGYTEHCLYLKQWVDIVRTQLMDVPRV